ncbi:hypothetical protein Vafri_20673 [Volvox africanus]|uniref:Uncharacterized protein n=1 Tax=Volvox africanus TaxID=51714 RepID=A0A8J4BU52_9CHLO|nr:hypothetical protein Vafri_20673 [Volvox africanus]
MAATEEVAAAVAAVGSETAAVAVAVVTAAVGAETAAVGVMAVAAAVALETAVAAVVTAAGLGAAASAAVGGLEDSVAMAGSGLEVSEVSKLEVPLAGASYEAPQYLCRFLGPLPGDGTAPGRLPRPESPQEQLVLRIVGTFCC